MNIFRAIAANRWIRYSAVTFGVFLAAVTAIELTLRSNWFAETVRSRLVTELESATGGTATIGKFRFGRDRLAFVVEGIELRGKEAKEAPPLLSIRRVELRIRIESFLGRKISLEHLRVVEPHASILVFDDGSTNIPPPRRSANTPAGEQSPLQPLLDLAVKQLHIDGGTLEWNGQPYEAALRAADCTLETALRADPPGYEIRAEIGEFNWNTPLLSGMPTSLAIEALLDGSNVGLTRFAMTNDALNVEAAGTLSDFRQPRFTADYTVTAHSSDLARLLDIAEPPVDGRFQVNGEVAWQSGDDDIAYSGNMVFSGTDSGGSGEALDIRSQYSGNKDRILMPGLSLTALEGRVTGDVAISEISTAPRFAFAGAASDFSVARLAEIAGIGSLLWSGSIHGELEVEGTSAADLAVQMKFTVEPTPAAGFFPIQGQGEVRYEGASSRFEIPAIRLRSRNTDVDLSGSLNASDETALAVRARTTALDEYNRILQSLGVEVETPNLDGGGEIRLDGYLSGMLASVSSLAFDGKLYVWAFSTGNQKWESLSADARVTAAGASVRAARLSDGEGTIDLTGSVPFNGAGDLRATVSAKGLDVRKSAAAFGVALPVAGILAANLNASGALLEPELTGDLTLTNVEVDGESFDRLTATVDYRENAFAFRDALLARGDARLRANATFAPDTKEFQFALASSNWPLEEFAFVRRRQTPLTGIARFDLEGEGRQGSGSDLFHSLTLDGDWEVADLQRADQELGSLKGNVRTVRNKINIDWQAKMLAGEASGESVLTPVGEGGYVGAFRFKNFETQAVAELLALPLSKAEGQIDGQAEYSGELGAPEKLRLNGTIDRFEAGISDIGSSTAGYRISNLFPMRWSYDNYIVRLDSMNLNGNGTDIGIDGTIAVRDERALDITVDGRFNLILLESFNPDIDASGASNLNVKIGGTVNDLEAEGAMVIVDGALRSAEFPNGLSDINGKIDFVGRQMKIDQLSATSGGGSLRLSGVTIFGDNGPEYRLQAAAQRVRLRYPANISSVLDGQLTLAGTGNRMLLNGEVSASRLTTAKDLTFGNLFASFRQPAQTQADGSILQNVQLNVRVVSVPNLAIETSLVKNVRAEIDLKVVGTGASPSLLGHVGITQGTIQMFGTRYHFNRGDVNFVNPFRIEPVLNVEMETRIRDIDLALVLSGPVRKLNLNYRSDPPLPFNDLVNLVAVGRAPTVDPILASRQRVEQQSLIQTGANNLLASVLARPVSQRLQRFFGVSRLKVDPQIGGPEANPSARISTEQQIANDLTFTYSYDLSSAQQQVVRIEWAPDRRWSFIVTRDENGLVGSDFLYKTRLP